MKAQNFDRNTLAVTNTLHYSALRATHGMAPDHMIQLWAAVIARDTQIPVAQVVRIMRRECPPEMPAVFTHYTDPGHGWIAVKRDHLRILGVAVSRCSFQRGQTVYLEEDRDWHVFRLAFIKRYGMTPGIVTKFTTGDKRSPIRSYDAYTTVFVD